MHYLFKGYMKIAVSLIFFMLTGVMIIYVVSTGLETVQGRIYNFITFSENHQGVKAHDFQDSNVTRFNVGKAHLQFLPNFKSPCWLEKLPDNPPPMSSQDTIYSNNAYVRNKHYTKYGLFGRRIESFMRSYPQGVLMEDEFGLCGPQKKCRVRCLPYFMLLGMAKSGTSDFYSRMKTHPIVYPATNKELFYWTQYRFQINASLGDFADLFDSYLRSAIHRPIKDEISGQKYYPYAFGDFTSVTFTDEVWWRDHPGNKGLIEPKFLKIHDLYEALPNIKLIAILRNPTSRLYSSYNMFRRSQPSAQDFHARVVKSIEWWHNCTVLKRLPRRTCAYGSPPEMPPVVCVLADRTENNRWYGQPNVANYSGEIRRGMYQIFIKDWYSVFPKKQILFLKTEEYSIDPLKTFNNVVLPFLDIPKVSDKDTTAIDKESHSNSRKYEPMLPETKKLLDDFYAPFNKELAEYMGDDKWLWKD